METPPCSGNKAIMTTFSSVKDSYYQTSPACMAMCRLNSFVKERKREGESCWSTEGVWENRMETRSKWETADWTYGFGKFVVLFSEQFPAVNLQCLCKLLLKPNPWSGQGRSFQQACRENFFSWRIACPFNTAKYDRQEKIKVYTCVYINLPLHQIYSYTSRK